MQLQSFRTAMVAVLFATAACSDNASTAPITTAGTLTIASPASTVYEADIHTFTATFRNADGVVVPDAPVTWSVSDTLRAELAANGLITALKAGNVRVTAKSGATTATFDLAIVRPGIQSIAVFAPTTMGPGDVAPIGVRTDGPGGRVLLGRTIQLSSDNPNVAAIDASGRVRAIAAGTANIRASSEGVTGTVQVRIESESVVLRLSRHDGAAIPVLVASDTVSWNGEKEFHEVYLERGTLELWGGTRPKYELEMRYAEYNVIFVNGLKQLQLRMYQRDYDRGIVAYDARGDMQMTSEYIHPLSHVGSPISGGIEVNFRIAGTNERHMLFFRREPN